MNKMSEVFDLPVKPHDQGHTDEHQLKDCASWIVASKSHMEAAAHAINSHDPLTERVKVLELVLKNICRDGFDTLEDMKDHIKMAEEALKADK